MELEWIVAEEQNAYPNRGKKSTDRTKDSLGQEDPSREIRDFEDWVQRQGDFLVVGALVSRSKLGVVMRRVNAVGKVPNPNADGRRFCNDVPRVKGGPSEGDNKRFVAWPQRWGVPTTSAHCPLRSPARIADH